MPCELGDLEVHHVGAASRTSSCWRSLLGVLGDHFAGHRRMLLVGDGVDGEELNLFVVKP